MSGRLIRHGKVADDLLDLSIWFSEQIVGLGDLFIDAVEATLNDLRDWPGKGSIKFKRRKPLVEIRSWPVNGFPRHLIFYHVIDGGIRVLAVMHGARNFRRHLKDRP